MTTLGRRGAKSSFLLFGLAPSLKSRLELVGSDKIAPCGFLREFYRIYSYVGMEDLLQWGLKEGPWKRGRISGIYGSRISINRQMEVGSWST